MFPRVFSTFPEFPLLRMLPAKTSYGIVLATETLSGDHGSMSPFSCVGYSPQQTSSFDPGVGFLTYLNQSHTASILHHTLFTFSPDAFWFHMQQSELSVYGGCTYRPPNSNNSDISRLTQVFLYTLGLPFSRKIIAGHVNALKFTGPVYPPRQP